MIQYHVILYETILYHIQQYCITINNILKYDMILHDKVLNIILYHYTFESYDIAL